ncbi:hypothetical protein AVEN_31368-1 [Araneus ventricosus]|uniref:Uncharacterized protein n=1 Tax=Araneus ventricosus TaxID=182803 RepID=A0A4Y2FZ52_ARAVE|nr:hypothetical protein AVEN_31368-1 [Araneus ventricosus]
MLNSDSKSSSVSSKGYGILENKVSAQKINNEQDTALEVSNESLPQTSGDSKEEKEDDKKSEEAQSVAFFALVSMFFHKCYIVTNMKSNYYYDKLAVPAWSCP